jgi:hypothetical protein
MPTCCDISANRCIAAALLPKPSGVDAGAFVFLPICRTLRCGGTRIRTGETMIFNHLQEPLGMRKNPHG